MPVYCYKCNLCGKRVEQLRRIEDRNLMMPCDCTNLPLDAAHIPGTNCGILARDIGTEHVASSNQDYDKAILSEAMGVAPSQVAEHRRLHPTIPMTDDGRVLVRNHAEHKRIMRHLGFHDRSGFN